MSIPGLALGLAPPLEQSSTESRIVHLPPGSEWRFEVSFESTVHVTLLPTSSYGHGASSSLPNGNASSVDDDLTNTAEIFGSELAPSRSYTFTGTKAAIYTNHGCRLSINGDPCESDYVADETPVSEYINVHFALENVRHAAASLNLIRQQQQAQALLPPNRVFGAGVAGSEQSRDQALNHGGPRVLVLGPENAGKTSLVKTLTAYATRAARSPCVVNLDPREGMLCLPGSVSAAVFASGSVLDVEDTAGAGWGSSPIVGGPTILPAKMPLVYHYGASEKVEEAPGVFAKIATRLALAVTSRYEEDEAVKEAGIIVDMPGSVSTGKGGYDLINHVISEFSITTILTLGSERLHSDLIRRYPQPPSSQPAANHEPVSIIKLTKSGGCVDRDKEYMKELRHAQIKQYFLGGRAGKPSTAKPGESQAQANGGQGQPGQHVDKTPNLSPFTSTVEARGFGVVRMSDPSSDLSLAFLPGDATTKNPMSTPTQSSSTPMSGTSRNPGALSNLPDKVHLKPTTVNTLAAANALLVVKHANPPSCIVNLPSHSSTGQSSSTNVLEDADLTDVEKETVRDAPVLGYLYVGDVDEEKGRARIMSPVGGRLPGRATVWGLWPEGEDIKGLGV